MRSTLALLLLFGAVIGVTAGPCAKHPLTGQLELPTDAQCEHTAKHAQAETHVDAYDYCMTIFPTAFLTGEISSGFDDNKKAIRDSDGNVKIKCTVEKHEPCKLYELPKEKPCQTFITWKVHNDVQATATCLEYFPTTFVTGVLIFDARGINTGKIKCTVQVAYQCLEPDSFAMFDKCYKFPKTGTTYVEGTITDYTGTNKKCGKGKLSVFYSYTQAKFLGMKAKGLGLEKLWIGVTKDGNIIEEPKTKIHSELWKVVEGSYWDVEAEKLVLKTYQNAVPDAAKYYFMRTRNDEFNQRYQGSFERATDKIKATFACEFEAKFNAHQKWYCDKMGSLGLDTYFDSNKNKPRCLYVTANKYTWDGTVADMANIKGCNEKPSELHSVGMDDGTAYPTAYLRLKHQQNEQKLRLAGTSRDTTWVKFKQGKCKALEGPNRLKILMSWMHLEHKGKTKIPAYSSLNWDDAYPMNECSDFPGESITLGLKKGKMVDLPPEVRAPAICSLIFFQECENRNPCGDKLECTNMNKFETNGFYTCKCPGEAVAHKRVESGTTTTCEWLGDAGTCAWFDFYDVKKFYPVENNLEFFGAMNDKLTEAIVKDGCKLSVTVHAPSHKVDENFYLLEDAGYGTHDVPNSDAGTMAGTLEALGASSYKCTC